MAVGKGSEHPPRLVQMTYTPSGESRATIALVGKGITFDTGGMNLKPTGGIETMKTDMAGAAAVVGAMRAIAELDLPFTVLGILASAENMPSGTAFRPGDVLTRDERQDAGDHLDRRRGPSRAGRRAGPCRAARRGRDDRPGHADRRQDDRDRPAIGGGLL